MVSSTARPINRSLQALQAGRHVVRYSWRASSNDTVITAQELI
jgi:hypothetical protein